MSVVMKKNSEHEEGQKEERHKKKGLKPHAASIPSTTRLDFASAFLFSLAQSHHCILLARLFPVGCNFALLLFALLPFRLRALARLLSQST